MKVITQKNNTVVIVSLDDVINCGTENIIKLYNMATDEEKQFDWYADARKFAQQLAEKFNLDIVIVAKVIAALSPRQKWETNMRMAELCIESWFNNVSERPKVHTFGAMSKTAYNILDGNAYTLGPKVTNFAANIIGYDNLVTVDSLAISIPLGFYEYAGSYKFKTSVYTFVESLYIQAAKALGIAPSKLQAVVWIVCRNLKIAKKAKFGLLDAYNVVGGNKVDLLHWLNENN